MSAANELFGVDTFIIGKLKANAALAALVGTRIYTDMAPEKEPGKDTPPPFPYVIVLFLSAVDRNALPADIRILSRPLYLVKAVTEEDSYASANAINKLIEAALVGQEGPIPAEGIYVGKWFRERPIRYPEVIAGRRVNHLGGQFRSMVSSYP